eukprot:Skav216837  [mRNA]  locus=scaffold1340:203771:205411:+ [translate_table: standard]
MLASQIKHFGESDDNCGLCGQPDSYVHRALHCTATADVRSRFPDLITLYDDLDPCHVNFPVVYHAPCLSYNQWHFANRPEPVLTAESQAIIQNEISTYGKVVFYTDGSCDHPHDPHARRASHAAVLGRTIPVEEQKQQVARWLATGDIPSAFHVCLLGETWGKQSIPRAELQIIAAVAALQIPAEVWTDSQYACDLITVLQHMPDLNVLHKRRNYDVIRHMWTSIRRPDFRVCKLKAHDIQVDRDTHAETWHKLGNHAADQAAKQYLQYIHRTQPLQLEPDRRSQALTQCTQWYTYLHELQVDRAKLFQQDLPQQPIGHRLAPWTQQYETLQTWDPPHSWSFTNEPDYQQLLHLCVWGSQYSDLLLRWAAMLRWPLSEDDHDPHQLGVTWSELAVSFLYTTQYGIVVNSGGQHAQFRPELVPPNTPRTPWSIQVASFERALRSLQTRLPEALFPDTRSLAKSYRVLGGDTTKHGLQAQPNFPYQSEVAITLSSLIAEERLKPGSVLVPTVPSHIPMCEPQQYQADIDDTLHGWHLRINRARRHDRA